MNRPLSCGVSKVLLTRRQFVGTASLAGGVFLGPRNVMAGESRESPSSDSFRFAVIFDTHYCLDRTEAMPPGSAEATTNSPQYMWMRRHLFPKLVAELKLHAPELVLCTGDIVEGGRAETALLRRELQEVFEQFAAAKLPVIVAKGNHDPKPFYSEIALPMFASVLGKPVAESCFVFDRRGCRFVILDYLALGPTTAQAQWLREQWAATPKDRPLFAFTHASLVNVARPFFSHEPMQQTLNELFATRPPTVLFCGHTHNQALTYHRRAGGAFVQIKGSTVGFPDAPIEPLDNRHVLLLGNGDTYFWGVPEDQCPGYWILDVSKQAVVAAWYGVGHGLQGRARLSLSGGEPIIEKKPEFAVGRLTVADLPLVREASLEAFMSGDKAGDFEFILNGQSLGRMAPNANYAGRHSLPLGKAAIRSLSGRNDLTVTKGSADSWLLGAARLTARTLDGRFLVSPIPRTILACGEVAKRAGGDARFRIVDANEPIALVLEIEGG